MNQEGLMFGGMFGMIIGLVIGFVLGFVWQPFGFAQYGVDLFVDAVVFAPFIGLPVSGIGAILGAKFVEVE